MRKFAVIIPAIILLGAMTACGSKDTAQNLAELTSEVDGMLDGVLMPNPFDSASHVMPDQGARKLKVNTIGPITKVFNDSNYRHLEAAAANGIKPMDNLAETWRQGARLEKITSCREFYVDRLTHSLPYLTPGAKSLLTDIGRAFNDSLQARGGGNYRIKVTSVTRTPDSVSKLQRRNVNASQNSAHQYGTTFDISYAKFINDDTDVVRTQEDLKNLLAEVVAREKELGRCYVKFERKQGCFHITSRE